MCSAADERPGGAGEDIPAGLVLMGELDRAVQLDHGPVADGVRDEIDSDKRGTCCTSCRERDLARSPRGIRDGPTDATKGDVRSPLAVGGDSEDRADDAPGGDEDAEVIPLWRHELLDEHALLLEPGRARERRQCLDELVLVRAPR